MENIKTIVNHNQNLKKFSFSYSKTQKRTIKDYFRQKANNSLKSRKSQSLSTNYEEKKDEVKQNLSKKNIFTKVKDFLNNSNNEEKIFHNKEEKKENNYINNVFIYKEKIIKNQKENYVNFQSENKDKDNKVMINYYKYKKYPITMPELFNCMYILSSTINIFCNRNCYDKLNYYKIPNIFYNHLMIKNNIKNKNYCSCSITKRTKNKLLTIIFYHPIKKKYNDKK